MKNFLSIFILVIIIKITFAQTEITKNEIFKHIEFLASDSLKGRFPGTPEDKVAADYILSDFKKSGCEVFENSGFQKFEIPVEVSLGQNNYLKINDILISNENYTPLSYSATGNFKAEICFAGYGFDLKNDTMAWNDYDGLDVNNKWVIILRDMPKTNIPRDFFSLEANDKFKVLKAQEKGAAGVILVSGFESFKYEELSELILNRIPGNAEIPVIHLKREIIEQIFNENEKSLKEIEKQINELQSPVNFAINSTIETNIDIISQTIETQNVIAYIEGQDSVLKNQYIVIGAHYDHLGFGGKESGSKLKDTLAIHNGADDNASGTAAILEIAEKLNSNSENLERSIIIIAFGGEEKGMIGSKYFVNNPIVDLENIDCMINIDMIGRYRKTKGLNIFGVGNSDIFEEIVDSVFSKSKFKINKSQDSYGGSDHVSFKNKKIPVMVFNTCSHNDYHTPNDDTKYINTKKQTEICKNIYSVVFELANYKGEIDYNKDIGF